jgi:cytochrome oxidase Cu insertion factor (SCO1/SenC/PrrC family)
MTSSAAGPGRSSTSAASPVPVTSAPGFTLTDLGGQAMSLAGLRGRVVVLDFMDPHCTDICPIVSREFIDAYRDLGATAPRVAFVAVNVNRYHLQVADVAAFSGEQQLTQIPAWHFLTGSYPSLRAVWQACQIEVAAPGPDADVIHSGCRSGVAGTGAGRPGLLLAKLSGMEMIWFRSRWQS